MIEFKGVSKHFTNGHSALVSIDLSVKQGELLFITGHSGAGKSTLLKLLALLERPSEGEILVLGHPIQRLAAHRIPQYRRQVGVIFQDHQLILDRTVFDNIALPLRIHGMRDQDIRRRVRAVMARVGLDGKALLYPPALSGGEQQRVGIARAMVNRPGLLLADEPTGNLDPDLSMEIFRLFEQFSELGTTVIIATHDTMLTERFNYRQVHLHNGHILSEAQAAHGSSGVTIMPAAEEDFFDIDQAQPAPEPVVWS
jgi:cell division transport system ATP-binding protein